MTGWALFHVCPWILHPFCQRERTLWGITTPLLAGFSFDLVSAKAPRHTWFWSHALLNDGIMKLCVCTFLSLSFLGSFVENSFVPHPHGTVPSWGILKMLPRGEIRESGLQNSLVNISTVEGCKWVWKCWSNLLPCYRIFTAPAHPCQGYETPCSDKPRNLTLCTESVAKNHPPALQKYFVFS